MKTEIIFVMRLVLLQILSGLLADQFIDVVFFEGFEIGLAGVSAACIRSELL
jgi:hypothetical protein